MRRYVVVGAILALAVTAVPVSYATAQEFHAKLKGFNEVPSAIVSNGQGTVHLKLNKKLKTINYTLTFSDLSAPVTQSHIHIGKVHVAGGVTVFFCSNIGAPAGTQLCPSGTGGTVSGMIVAANILAIPGQGMPAGDFDELVRVLESRTGYANVHSTNFPGGEIRGQIVRDDDENNKDD
jgi:hypothetical protein